MKNRVKLRTAAVIAAVYLFALAFAIEAGGGAVVLLVLYSVAAIAGGSALLASNLAAAERDAQTFRKVQPLRGYGTVLIDFQHVFYHDETLLPAIYHEINARLDHQEFLPALRKKDYTDMDKNLTEPETREFLVASSEPNLRGTAVTLAVHLRKCGKAQSVQWWVLMRGFVDRNKKVALLASSTIALPFWIWAQLKQELDLASSVRTVYDAFYNSLDVATTVRSAHRLVFDALVDTLEKHGVDTSDLKLQRAQALTVNISGGRARFGNIIQALGKAKVVQTGGRQ